MDALTKRLIERLGGLERRLAIVEAAESMPSVRTWSPAITGSTGNPTINYTSQVGKYIQIGNAVFFSIYIQINTISGGSGSVRISLPLTLSNDGNADNTVCPIYFAGPDIAGTPISLIFGPQRNTAYGTISAIYDNAAAASLTISGLAANDVFVTSGIFFV